MKKYFNIVLVIFSLCIINSCKRHSRMSNEFANQIEGTYIFQYPTNEIEVLIMDSDSTFVQKIYKDKANFNLKEVQPLFVNRGEWLVTKNEELNFKDWLEYCDFRNPDSIVSQPENVFMLDVYWNRPIKNHKKGSISIYAETGYEFFHIEDWIE